MERIDIEKRIKFEELELSKLKAKIVKTKNISELIKLIKEAGLGIYNSDDIKNTYDSNYSLLNKIKLDLYSIELRNKKSIDSREREIIRLKAKLES